LETNQTLASIAAIGFASRRKTTWTLAIGYEITSILADGTYGEPTFGVKTDGKSFSVSRDADGKAEHWFDVVGNPGRISESGMRVIGANGEQLASVKPVKSDSEKRFVCQVTEPTGKQVMALDLYGGEFVDPSERVVKAGGREVGRFWRLNSDCCAIKLGGLRSVDPRTAIALLLFMHGYFHRPPYVGDSGSSMVG